MMHISEITLNNALPAVFADESRAHAQSQVWLGQNTFATPNFYMVEAPSGTGKTSLCAYLYGLRKDYDGTILFDGRDIREFSINDWCALRRENLAFLPQDLGLFPELSVMDNILVKNRLTDRLTEAEIRRMLERLAVDHRADWPAGKLSIGQQQRVAIIRAVAQPFDFLLLDEPVSHLDAANNTAAASLIAECAAANNAGVIATSVGNPLALAGALNLHL